MTMWKVTVKPDEDVHAWNSFVQQRIVGIGWPDSKYDSQKPVVMFQTIQVGDWVVAHVPPSHGGANALAKAVGKVMGEYEQFPRSEMPNSDGWTGAFRRQFPIRWTIWDVSLRGILNSYEFRNTVVKLSPIQERTILDLYGLR